MGFRSLVRWIVGLSVLAWAGYTAVSATSSYLATQGMVDQVLQEASAKVKTVASTGGQPSFEDLAADVRVTLLIRARRYGISLDERGLGVLPANGGLTVKLKWSHPAVTYRGDPIVVVPMTMERSVSGP